MSVLLFGEAFLLLRGEVDFLARLQADVRLFPAATPALVLAEALGLAADVGDLHAVDVDLEHRLDGRFHFGLGRVGHDLEDHLRVLVGDVRALLGHDRGEQHEGETPGIELSGGGHPSISSNCTSAPLVSSTWLKRKRLTGSTSRVSSTSTSDRLRDDRKMLSSNASTTTSTVPSRPSDLIICAKSLVFGASTAMPSITESRSSRTSCERIAATPARYILRLTLCEKFSSGELGKIFPPPRHSGLFAWPARARPVPFCAHGFLCDLLTSARPFCLRLPLRAFAWYAVTSWWISDSL